MVEFIENIGVRKDIAKSPEAKIEIERFIPEAKEALKKEGYLIYELTGKSVNDLRKEGRKINWERDPDMRKRIKASDNDENDNSVRSEVAIRPDNLYLLDSGRDGEGDKLAFEKFSAELAKKIPGVKARIGNPADYAGIIFQYKDTIGESLFHNFIGTETSGVKWNPTRGVPNGHGVVTGLYLESDKISDTEKGLVISDYPGGAQGGGIPYIAPLVVPAESLASKIKRKLKL